MDKIDSQSVKYSVSASDHTTYLDIPGMTGISGPAENKNPSVFCSVCVILHIRQVMDRLYSAAPDGYCGDEDNGQTSPCVIPSTTINPKITVHGENHK